MSGSADPKSGKGNLLKNARPPTSDASAPRSWLAIWMMDGVGDVRVINGSLLDAVFVNN